MSGERATQVGMVEQVCPRPALIMATMAKEETIGERKQAAVHSAAARKVARQHKS